MSARAVIAIGQPFAPRGAALADPGVALDEILSLRGDSEPLVLRVAATGGNKTERASVEGDWLCDSGGAEPRRVPKPKWKFGYTKEVVQWSSARTWLDAWEECEDARWMLLAAASVAVDRRLLVLATCACARTALELLPEAETRPLRAIEWAESYGSGDDVGTRLRDADDAAQGRLAARMIPAYHAAQAARWAAISARDKNNDYRTEAVDHVLAAFGVAGVQDPMRRSVGVMNQRLAALRCADLVREIVPTIAVLRAAAGGAKR